MKKRPIRALQLIVLTLLMVLASALSACGESAQDEFVGTWRQLDYQTRWTAPLVIAKADGGYTGTLVYSDKQPTFDLTRTGDTLKGELWTSRGNVPCEIVFQAKTGHLIFSAAALPGGPVTSVELMKVSPSTTIQTTSPQ
jgi:hypothetical protein